MKIFFIAVIVLLGQVASAQTAYRWVGEDGTINYTDDVRSIPKGIKPVATTGGELQFVNSVKDGKDKEDTSVAGKPHSDKPSVELPGGKDEVYWRTKFKELQYQILHLSAEIEADHQKYEEQNGLPVTTRMQCQNIWNWTMVHGHPVGSAEGCVWTTDRDYEDGIRRLRQNRLSLDLAKRELAELERQASFASVPREWRSNL